MKWSSSAFGGSDKDLGTFRGEGSWGVSTLTSNPITGTPIVTLFTEERLAIKFARMRAIVSGDARRKKSGRVMYVIKYDDAAGDDEREESAGTVLYRVLRGQRGGRAARGSSFVEHQEQVMVFSNEGLLPTGTGYRWKMVKGLTVDVRDVEEEREKTRLMKGPKAMTIFDRYGDA